MSGVYMMRLPAGSYNVTVDAAGYNASSMNVTISANSRSYVNFSLSTITVAVSPGSSSAINFYLIQTQVPVPEFQPGLTLTLIALTLAVTLLFKRSRK
jgi:hypothetical protein